MISVGDDDDLLIHQNAREGQNAVEESGNAEVLAVAGDGPEVKAAVAQRGAFAADRGDLRDVLVVRRCSARSRDRPTALRAPRDRSRRRAIPARCRSRDRECRAS